MWNTVESPSPRSLRNLLCGRCFPGFGTALASRYEHQYPIPMKPNTERARKLKDAATRMMMAGNVERYVHALRLLFALRARQVAMA